MEPCFLLIHTQSEIDLGILVGQRKQIVQAPTWLKGWIFVLKLVLALLDCLPNSSSELLNFYKFLLTIPSSSSIGLDLVNESIIDHLNTCTVNSHISVCYHLELHVFITLYWEYHFHYEVTTNCTKYHI